MGNLLHAERLEGLHPKLKELVVRVAHGWRFGVTVVEGVRSDEQCFADWGKGRTSNQCTAVGCPTKYSQPHVPKVTWLAHPLSSKHRRQPSDGYGHAVDLLPEPYDWKLPGHFQELATAMMTGGALLGVKLRWGADWDQDGVPGEKGERDFPHFEIVAAD